MTRPAGPAGATALPAARVWIGQDSPWRRALAYGTLWWALSRVIVVATMLLTAKANAHAVNGSPLAPGWSVFSYWDSGWYFSIVSHGYEYARDTAQHSVAFFPLFPMLAWLPVHLGLSFVPAGMAINNAFFWGTLVLLFHWTEASLGRDLASWTTAALAFNPLSFYGTVVYSEGLYLFVTTAALWSFHQRRYYQAACWGVLATATRLPGVAVPAAMLACCLVERLPKKAYAAACASGLGLAGYAAYLGWRFGDPLAFLHAEHAWQRTVGIDWAGWIHVLTYGMVGPVESGGGLLSVLLVFGGFVLLKRYSRRIPPVAFWFGLASLLIVLLAGQVASAERYAFGIVSLSMVFGLFLKQRRGRGIAAIAYAAILLAILSRQFALQMWVA